MQIQGIKKATSHSKSPWQIKYFSFFVPSYLQLCLAQWTAESQLLLLAARQHQNTCYHQYRPQWKIPHMRHCKTTAARRVVEKINARVLERKAEGKLSNRVDSNTAWSQSQLLWQPLQREAPWKRRNEEAGEGCDERFGQKECGSDESRSDWLVAKVPPPLECDTTLTIAVQFQQPSRAALLDFRDCVFRPPLLL